MPRRIAVSARRAPRPVVRTLRWRGALEARLLPSVATVAALTVLARLAGVPLGVLLARRFGTADVLDAFLLAVLLPGSALSILRGSLQAAVVPAYIRVREVEGEPAAERLASNVAMWYAGVVVLTLGALAAVGPILLGVIGSGFSAEKLALTQRLFYAMLAMLPFGAAAGFWSALLNADGRFALASAVPAVSPCLTIGLLLVTDSSWSVAALVLGMIVGAALEAALVAWRASQVGLSVRFRWGDRTAAAIRVAGQFWPTAGSVILMASTTVVDQAMAATLGDGRVSALNYGTMPTAAMIYVGSTAVGTVVLPHLSRLVSAGEWGEIRREITAWTGLVVAVGLVVAAVMASLSDMLVRALFAGGAFTENDVRVVSRVHALYVLQLPAFLAGLVGVRLLSAMERGEVLVRIATVNVVVNGSGNLVLMRYLDVAGISLSTTIMYALSAILIYTAVFRELRCRQRGSRG